jgi:hypothetical protein
MGMESGKGSAGGSGRNTYRREYRQPERNYTPTHGERQSATTVDSSSSISKGFASEPSKANGSEYQAPPSPQQVISGLEKKLSGMQQDFTHALHKISEKENEKFDLIFAILSELQSRQAQLEDSVRSLKSQLGGSHMCQLGSGTTPAHMGPQYGQMGGQMGGSMSSQQPMQQFAGVMHADGSQTMFTAVPQVLVVSSPTANGMQYVPQMMSPSSMQPMQQMVQFVGHGSQDVLSGAQDMSTFVANQDSQAACAQPVSMRSSSTGWNPKAASGAHWSADGSVSVGLGPEQGTGTLQARSEDELEKN